MRHETETVALIPWAIERSRAIATRIPRKYRDEAKSCALLGLVLAARRFRPELGVSLKSFAVRRVEGEILDMLKRADTVGRPTRKKIQAGELPGFTEVSLDAFRTENGRFFDVPAPKTAPPERALTARALLRYLRPRERQVVLLRFWGEASPLEIAQCLGVGESRVFQIQHAAILRLRSIANRPTRKQLP